MFLLSDTGDIVRSYIREDVCTFSNSKNIATNVLNLVVHMLL